MQHSGYIFNCRVNIGAQLKGTDLQFANLNNLYPDVTGGQASQLQFVGVFNRMKYTVDDYYLKNSLSISAKQLCSAKSLYRA